MREDVRPVSRLPEPASRGRGTNQEKTRRHNLGTVLRHLHRDGQLTRSELTRRTSLNRSTIADLTTELESMGIAERTDPLVEGVGAGRPSVGVRLSPSGPYVVAVDLTVDRVSVARVGLGGRIDGRSQRGVEQPGDARAVAATVAGLVDEVVRGAPTSSTLVALGVAVPGLVGRGDGMVRLAPTLEWHDVPLGSLLLAGLGLDLPVVVGNDANLGALVEHERGAGVGVDDLVYISGRIGVGAGIIAGGGLLGGSAGFAGEVGHLQIDPGGLECHCGSSGCWETLVGGHAIAAAIGCPPADVARLAEHLDRLDVVPPELDRIAHDIGRGLGSIANAFNPQLILLGGYFSALLPHVREQVAVGLERVAMRAVTESTTLALPALAADAVLLGAAEAALEGLLVDPVGSLPQLAVDAAGPLGD